MGEQATGALAIFDFDGTLVRLVTDYRGLRQRLEDLAASAGLAADGGILKLVLRLEDDAATRESAGALVAAAELEGLRKGTEVDAGLDEYRRFSETGARTAIASHNGREVIEAFFHSRQLTPPNETFDRRVLGGPKHESPVVPDYVRAVRPSSLFVIGNDESDEALAHRLVADFIRIDD